MLLIVLMWWIKLPRQSWLYYPLTCSSQPLLRFSILQFSQGRITKSFKNPFCRSKHFGIWKKSYNILHDHHRKNGKICKQGFQRLWWFWWWGNAAPPFASTGIHTIPTLHAAPSLISEKCTNTSRPNVQWKANSPDTFLMITFEKGVYASMIFRWTVGR